MKSIGPEVVAYWIAGLLYGVAAAFQIVAFIQKKKEFSDIAIKIAWLGLASHTVNFMLPAVKQSYTGICSFDKVVGGVTWMGMIAFVGATLAHKAVRPAATLILPVSFGMMVVGGILPCHPLGPSPVFKGWQLWLHVMSGGFTYGFALLAAAMSLFYVQKANGKTGYPYDELPELKALDQMKDRFFLTAVVLSTLMIHFGLLWAYMNLPAEFIANTGNSIRYLATAYWTVFALWAFLRYGLRWTGKKLVWYAPVSLVIVMVFTFYLAPFQERGYHRGPFFPPYDKPQQLKKLYLQPKPAAKAVPENTKNIRAAVSPVDQKADKVMIVSVNSGIK